MILMRRTMEALRLMMKLKVWSILMKVKDQELAHTRSMEKSTRNAQRSPRRSRSVRRLRLVSHLLS